MDHNSLRTRSPLGLGGGWVGADGAGALDFAGGTVIHINAGAAAVAAAILVGKRRNPGLQPNNVPYVILGASILWFGWFGFNGGSALAADDYAVNAMLVTQLQLQQQQLHGD